MHAKFLERRGKSAYLSFHERTSTDAQREILIECFRNSVTMRTVISQKDVGFLRKPTAISGNLNGFREGDACAFSESTNISRKDGARASFVTKMAPVGFELASFGLKDGCHDH